MQTIISQIAAEIRVTPQQVQAAGSKVDFGGNLSTYEALQTQLENLLARSNPAAT